MKSIKNYITEGTIHSVSNKVYNVIKQGMTKGYVTVEHDKEGKKYGISKQNIYKIDVSDDITIETLRKIVSDLEQNGAKWKFETDDEWKKAGFADPREE